MTQAPAAPAAQQGSTRAGAWAYVAVLAWAAASALVYLGWPEIGGVLAFYAGFERLALWLGFLVLARALISRAAERAWRLQRRAYLGALALLAAAGLVLLVWGARTGRQLRFELARPRYEAAVRPLLERPLPELNVDWEGRTFTRVRGLPGVWTGTAYMNLGPPRRVAFRLPGGIIDNYEAFVYDPTGLVLRGNRAAGPPPELQWAEEMFDGSMVWCELLEAPWYFCSFT